MIVISPTPKTPTTTITTTDNKEEEFVDLEWNVIKSMMDVTLSTPKDNNNKEGKDNVDSVWDVIKSMTVVVIYTPKDLLKTGKTEVETDNVNSV